MCGIAGILRFDQKPVSFVTLKRMTDSISHRGPDGEGIYVDGVLGLGHRRLSIIDLSSAGHQPMQSECGRYVLTYNGEVYNFRELRAELESRGYRFRSNTDSEVVLNAFCEWKDECVSKFNGMFAFAVWDKQARTVFLARDRYGIKPLYYYHTSTAFIFGSEIKAIISSGEYEATVESNALIEYLLFQNFFSSDTLFKDIKLLNSATTLSIDAVGRSHSNKYWDFDFEDRIQDSESTVTENCDYLLRQAVSRQLVADTKVNSYLSGGVDSGAISMLASQQTSQMKTFTIGFDTTSASGIEQSFDERGRAEYLSYLAQTEHYEMVLKPGDMERCISKLVWHLEEPRVGQSYPNFYAAKLASSFGKVVLAGTGGDELFAGYPWRYAHAFSGDGFSDFISHYRQYWQRLLSLDELNQLVSPLSSANIEQSRNALFHSMIFKSSNSSSNHYVNYCLNFEAKTFLHGLLLVEDKLSMAHGLETRLPMLDNDLVDYAMSIPISQKIKSIKKLIEADENYINTKQKQKGIVGKYILRKLLKKYVGSGTPYFKKQGFSAPDASWFRGESIDYVRSIVENKNSPIYDYLDYGFLNGLCQQHFDGKQNRRLLIWSVLYLNEFFVKFINERPAIMQKRALAVDG